MGSRGARLPPDGRSRALSHIRRQEVVARSVDSLAELVSFATFGSSVARPRPYERASRWLADHLRALGFPRVEVWRGLGPPSVFACWPCRGQPTVLMYGHYDVQPPGPRMAWSTNPFKLSIVGDALVGRGASDDKGQLLALLNGVSAHVATAGTPPVGVKVWVEGEEEVGSPNLRGVFNRHGDDLTCDLAVLSDASMLVDNRPAIVYGLRGLVAFDVLVYGASRPVHSGHGGGVIANPAHVLARAVAGLEDSTGRIRLPGFYRDVVAPTLEERRWLRALVPDDVVARRLGATPHGEPGWAAAERAAFRPAMTVTGLAAGPVDKDAVNAIPRSARARIGFRLVANQDSAEIAERVRRYFAEVCPPGIGAAVQVLAAVPPVAMSPRHPAISAACRAVVDGFGVRPTVVRSGGTIGVVGALHRRGSPVIVLGLGAGEDRIHAPGESFDKRRFVAASATSASLLSRLTFRGPPQRLTRSAGSREGSAA